VDGRVRIVRLGSALAVLCVAATARAGEIGPTSKATVTISLIVAPHLEVRAVDAGSAPASAGPLRTFAFCVSGNTATREYGVRLAADGGSSERPALEWADGANVSGGTSIGTGEPAAGFVASSAGCNPGSRANATLIVRSSPAAEQPSRPTLLIVPE